jgi:hypothetical protein
MPRYVAEFRKRVLSDTGHEVMIVERNFDLDARDRTEATELAKKRFCELQNIPHWTSHADEFSIEEADFPS